MMQCPMFVLCTILAFTTPAQASFDMMVNYEPETDVTQHSYIDLDQKEMELHLAASDFVKAKAIYLTGGNSGATAVFSVPQLASSLNQGALVTQDGNAAAKGYVKTNAGAGTTTVQVTYTSVCKQGGSSSPDTSGCFTTSGTLRVAGLSVGQPSAVTNKYRTLAGFSTAAKDKMAGQEFYSVYRAYFQHHDYANRFVMDALDRAGEFAGKDNIFRVECAKKGSAYQNVWMYVIREMEDAIMDCQVGCLQCNDDPVHAWDEAVAFYAGSLEGREGDSAGKLLYRLAEKRCANFGTCTGAAGHSAVNAEIIDEFRLGQYALNQGKCVEAIPRKKRIVELMSVPLVQGSLRYAYKIGEQNGGSKEIAEGVAFAAAILPRVAACDSNAAALIRANMGLDATSRMKDGFVEVKRAFERTYACMGITCADIGGILQNEDIPNIYWPLAEPCATQTPNTQQGSYDMMVYYHPKTDVRQHSYIDLDQKEMELHLAQSDFMKAKAIYLTGGNSGATAVITVPSLGSSLLKGDVVTQSGNAAAKGYLKKPAGAGTTTVQVTYTSVCKEGGSSSPDTSGCFTTSGTLIVAGLSVGQPSAVLYNYRTLAGFSTAAKAKMAGQPFYTAYRAYFGYHDYANRFVMAALDGSGDFSGKDDIFRVECAKKGSAYQNVWMYVIREMEDAIMDCQAGCQQCNDDPVHAWDEAVAFYAGSLEGREGSASGKLLYRLAEKRCANFGTCTGAAAKSAVNAQIIDEFRLGQYALNQGECVKAIPRKKRIVELMSVPLVQGSLRYAYKIGEQNGGSKEKAEGVAFTAAILPRVAACDSNAAALIQANMGANAPSPMKDGFVKVKQAFESTYACMGMTCADVGGYLQNEATNQYYPLAEPCISSYPVQAQAQTTEEVTKTPVWLIVLLIIAAVCLISMCAVAIFFRLRAKKYQLMAERSALSKNGEVVGQNQA